MRSRIQSRRSYNSDGKELDELIYEAQRLRLDAKARESMSQTSKREDDPRAWKWVIRRRVWDFMEAQNIAQNPRPVHHRIPNFVGASAAAKKVSELEAIVKVNPDSPQKQVRFLTLSDDKKLLTLHPRLTTDFFSILESSMLTHSTINEACTSEGVAKYGRPIGLDEKIKVDVIVIGSVAVDPKTGARLGKGEGFAELEYGMLRYMGAIDDSTPVVTSGLVGYKAVKLLVTGICITTELILSNNFHTSITGFCLLLVDDIPVEKLLVHDIPTQVIFTNTAILNPRGIYWDKLSPEKLGQIRILRELKSRIERETGHPLPCGPSERLPPTAQ
ncbi:hypothetical protein V6N13_129947 [Hibiscus sabdariffa]